MVVNNFNPQELQDFEDAEETLSFSDLPLHNSFSIEDYSKEHESSSFDQDNQFEFFSEDFTASYPTTDIIFCGKLIPLADNNQNEELKIPRINNPMIEKSQNFPWKSNSFSNSSSKQNQLEKRYKTCRSFPADQRYDNGRRKSKRAGIRVPRKSRWNLFGISFPGEMKLRDIKTRQNKREPARTMFRYNDKNDEIAKKVDRSKKLKGCGVCLGFLHLLRPRKLVN